MYIGEMVFIPNNDIEAIDHILNRMVVEEVPYWYDISLVKDFFDSSYSIYEVERIIRKMKKLELIKYHQTIPKLFQRSDYAIEIINEHKKYSNYISSTLTSKRKKEKSIIFDKFIKNGNIIAALLISSLSLILTQCPISSNKEQKKKEEDLQLLIKELDSIKQGLRNIQQQKELQPVIDTAQRK